MPPSNEPIRSPEPSATQQEKSRNERPYQGEKEPKFVIKCQTPVPF
jgi:hypothetical protein